MHTSTGIINFYRPQRSCGKVMFLHLSVILSTGGCLADTPPGRHPPRADTLPPRADTPPPETATAGDGTHPTGMHSCCIGEELLSFNLIVLKVFPAMTSVYLQHYLPISGEFQSSAAHARQRNSRTKRDFRPLRELCLPG